MKKVIVITGGGTLGHLLPIIPVVKEIYSKYDLIYIGTKKGLEKKYIEENDLKKYFTRLFYFDMEGLYRIKIIKNIKTIYKYLKVKKKISLIYKTYKVSLVIGMGGYISGVAIRQATKKKIKTIIHEQNAVMGLANKLVYKNVNKVLLSFPLEISSSNYKVIGNPRYSEIIMNHKSYEFGNTILIFGGSLGSKKINDLFIKNIDKMNMNDLYYIIVVGLVYYKDNEDEIIKINEKYQNIKVIDFTNNIIDIMKKASLVICRAGATTINEIIALRKVSILIPSPNVTNNHQYENAKFIKDKNACSLIMEDELSFEMIQDEINKLIYNYNIRNTYKENIKKIIQNDPKDDFIKEINYLICTNT